MLFSSRTHFRRVEEIVWLPDRKAFVSVASPRDGRLDIEVSDGSSGMPIRTRSAGGDGSRT